MSVRRSDTIALGLLKKEEEEEEECQIVIFYFARCVYKIVLYSDVIHSFDWKSAIEHNGGVIVDLARDIPAFVMYCVYGASRSSLLIESTDSMIIVMYNTIVRPTIEVQW